VVDGVQLTKCKACKRILRTWGPDLAVPAPDSVGQRSSEEPEHKVTARELFQLLGRTDDCQLGKPVTVDVPMGHATVCFATTRGGILRLSLAEEWE
jgi:hypothetical protein